MPKPQPHLTESLITRADQPLMGVIRQRNGQDVVECFAADADLDGTADEGVVAALSVIGAWSDMDFDGTLSALDRIRHESKPTPPIDLAAFDPYG